MPGMDMALLFYGGTVGGIFGAIIVSIALRRNHNDFIKLLSHYWSNDMRALKITIQELSTKSGDK